MRKKFFRYYIKLKILVILLLICNSYIVYTQESYFEYYRLRNQYLALKENNLKDSVFQLMLTYELPINELKLLKRNSNSKINKKAIKKKLKLRKAKRYESQYENKLKAIFKADQDVRKLSKGDSMRMVKMYSIDSLNKISLKALIDKYGYPTYEIVGEQSIKYFGVLMNHYVYDTNWVTVDKINYYFNRGSMDAFWSMWAIDKHLMLFEKVDVSYFNLFFTLVNKMEPNTALVNERRRKYGYSSTNRISKR